MSRSRNFTCYITSDDRDAIVKSLENKVTWYIGQDETGAHGMKHIQLMFGYKNAKTVDAVIKQTQIATVQIVRDPEATLQYCTDDRKRDPHGKVHAYGNVPAFSKKADKSLIEEAIETGDYDAAMKIIEDKDPIYYISNQKKLSVYFASKFDKSDKGLYDINQFVVSRIHDFKLVHVFIGSTGLGKTQFALSHFKNPLHIRDKEDWRRFSTTTDGIILDDLDFPKWSPLTFLKLLDIENPITQNIKYGSVRVPAGIPRIICVNHEELLWPGNIHEETRSACMRRMKIHHFHGKLFGPKPSPEKDYSKYFQKYQRPPVPVLGESRKNNHFRSPEVALPVPTTSHVDEKENNFRSPEVDFRSSEGLNLTQEIFPTSTNLSFLNSEFGVDTVDFASHVNDIFKDL